MNHAQSLLLQQYLDYSAQTSERDGDYFIDASLTPVALTQLRDYAMSQTITVLNNRVNAIGVAEAVVARQGLDRISVDLPGITDLENLGEHELDNLAKKAEDAYDDLMDLGMNVEVRYSGRIFEVAGGMLKNAIDAKSAKIDKKLKAVELKLKKLKIDRDAGDDDPNNVLNGQGYVITDRNELLKKLQGKE
jgi:preprotein translocase subunit SecD